MLTVSRTSEFQIEMKKSQQWDKKNAFPSSCHSYKEPWKFGLQLDYKANFRPCKKRKKIMYEGSEKKTRCKI